ncbi:MAG: nitroreductase family deazaflavin-dependent oxidoreductase [Subtercola sp.]|nr:nitroreductase family deazaflavin-dependent oxidoreductase [Subtercola sp.]
MPARTVASRLLRFIRSRVAWFSRTAFFRRVGPSIMPPLERAMKTLTGGRVQMSGLLVPSLVLRTTGAKSGLERQSTLMYVPEKTDSSPVGSMLVTGSNFARGEHPAWTTNLLANPDAVVLLHGRRISVTANVITDDEREAVWRYIENQWPGYRGYERASGRVLRIFRLVPVR